MEITQQILIELAVPPGAQVGGISWYVVSTSLSGSIVVTATTFTYYENSNYLEIPRDVIGINKVYQWDADGY